jgi:hypothetical protein
VVLGRPGAVPSLLTIAGKSADVEEFSDALLDALGSTSLPQAASLDDLRRLMDQA